MQVRTLPPVLLVFMSSQEVVAISGYRIRLDGGSRDNEQRLQRLGCDIVWEETCCPVFVDCKDMKYLAAYR
jgi:hypothetical protein